MSDVSNADNVVSNADNVVSNAEGVILGSVHAGADQLRTTKLDMRARGLYKYVCVKKWRVML